MKTMHKAWNARHAAKIALGVLAVSSTLCFAQAQGKDLSDNSVKWLMSGAWALTPPTYTDNGKTITIDKAKKAETMVPIDAARDIIKIAYRTASAQNCGLDAEVAANHGTFIAREIAKKKWSDQQLVYINQLHLFTVALQTGKMEIVAQEGDKSFVLNEKPAKVATCSDAEREKVREQVVAYVKAEGDGGAATAAATSPPAPAAAPVAKK